MSGDAPSGDDFLLELTFYSPSSAKRSLCFSDSGPTDGGSSNWIKLDRHSLWVTLAINLSELLAVSHQEQQNQQMELRFHSIRLTGEFRLSRIWEAPALDIAYLNSAFIKVIRIDRSYLQKK
jgi:hypothetical protein